MMLRFQREWSPYAFLSADADDNEIRWKARTEGWRDHALVCTRCQSTWDGFARTNTKPANATTRVSYPVGSFVIFVIFVFFPCCKLSQLDPERPPAQDQAMRVESREVESPYGSWRQTEGRWDELAGLLEAVWHFDGQTTFRRERAFPNGMLEIIVHLGEQFREIRDGRRADHFPVTCVNGLQTNSFIIEAPARPCKVLGIRLTPAGAYALLNTSLVDMRDITIDLHDVAGRCAAELTERCLEATSAEERVRVALCWVRERVARGVRVDPGIAWVAAQIERQNGAISIATLRDQIGFSKTRLVEGFRRQIGLSPKTFARVIRFRHVLQLLHAGAGSLSDVALEAGLYDQPHLNAEFKELSGFTPTEFLAALRYSPTSLAES